jgi:type IV secretory pathway TraG/TraD family ATPase VirD4
VLATHLAPHAFIAPGSFSLRRWVREASGALFLTWRSDMQAAVAPLIATWVGICANEILSLEPEACRRVWLLIDELAALGAIPALDEALTLGRKYGLCVVSGLQSTAQLDHLYGRERATTLRACFRTLAVLGISRTDPDTSEFLSRALGDREMVCNEESRALGDAGHTRSVAARRIVERTVLASEIAGLPDLTGYLAIAGSGALLPLQLKPAVRSRVIEPFEERPS